MENQEEEEHTPPAMVKLGSYGGEVMLVVQGEESAAEETMLLWGIQQPTLSKPNSFVSHSSLQLCLDSCGHSLSILQSPSSLRIGPLSSTPPLSASLPRQTTIAGSFPHRRRRLCLSKNQDTPSLPLNRFGKRKQLQKPATQKDQKLILKEASKLKNSFTVWKLCISKWKL